MERQYASHGSIPVELAGVQQRIFRTPAAAVSLRGFAADGSGLSFIVDVRADGVGEDSFDFAFDETAAGDETSCSIQVAYGPQEAGFTVQCHIQSGGGGVTDGLGGWTFRLRAPLPAGDDGSDARLVVRWPRMGLTDQSFEIDGAVIAAAAEQSHAITSVK